MSESQPDPTVYRELLLRREAELTDVAESADEAGRTVELDQARVGRLSRMDALQAQAMAKESDRRRVAELKRIGAALRRIEEGEYGYCLSCGELINEKRLHVDPAATHCVACAEKAES